MASDAPWLDYLARHVGEREIKGPKHNPLIVEWGKAAGIGWWNNDEDAWCAVAVNGALAASGLSGTKSALARSFLDLGRPLDAPVRGAIVVFPRGTNPLYGHVGIVETVNGDGTITIVNGNVGDMVKRSVRRVSEILPAGIRWPDTDRQAPPDTVDPVFRKHTLGDRPLRLGDHGEDVRAWQEKLNKLNYRLLADGDFGVRTQTATRRREELAGLPVDGVVDKALIAATDEKIAQKAKAKGKRDAAITGGAVGAGGVAAGGVVAEGSLLESGLLLPVAAVIVLAIVGVVIWRVVLSRIARARRRAKAKGGAA